MKELITITETENGQAVSAKELYKRLDYKSNHWSRWAKRNIAENDFAIEGSDYIELTQRVNGNKSNDYAVSISFAKELCMMAKNKSGKEMRLYFIECEKIALEKQKSNLPQTFSEALRLAAEQQEQIEKQEKIIEIQQDQKYLDQKLIDVIYDKSDRDDLIPKWRKY